MTFDFPKVRFITVSANNGIHDTRSVLVRDWRIRLIWGKTQRTLLVRVFSQYFSVDWIGIEAWEWPTGGSSWFRWERPSRSPSSSRRHWHVQVWRIQFSLGPA